MSSALSSPQSHPRRRIALAGALLALALGGCGLFGDKQLPKGTTPAEMPGGTVSEPPGGTADRQATPILPAFSKGTESSVGQSIGVNTFLWRGALDTVSFMPLVSADPFGGVIITDWYAPPETPQERFKLNIYILGKDLRAEALRVTVFHQKQTDGQWQDVASEQHTATELEDTILSRAERLRSQALGTTGGS